MCVFAQQETSNEVTAHYLEFNHRAGWGGLCSRISFQSMNPVLFRFMAGGRYPVPAQQTPKKE